MWILGESLKRNSENPGVDLPLQIIKKKRRKRYFHKLWWWKCSNPKTKRKKKGGVWTFSMIDFKEDTHCSWSEISLVFKIKLFAFFFFGSGWLISNRGDFLADLGGLGTTDTSLVKEMRISHFVNYEVGKVVIQGGKKSKSKGRKKMERKE